ncbi:hypothetical protein CBR_g26176 [Chara braunii]|uniref:Uncharacterized protein n=1 Tax=Chara braunii TaxID=69332 RepID=A0A388L750_CHABU|nr:hypothetical protein CBR_g26176 [Chara braunii]|eukprot:GBG78140.1 hypothetical protein CBR_g26176 [Chara braunii]
MQDRLITNISREHRKQSLILNLYQKHQWDNGLDFPRKVQSSCTAQNKNDAAKAEFSVLPKGKDVRRDLAPPCLGIVVSWNTSPLVAGLGGPPTMVVGWRCESAELSGAKIWEYSDAFQRWHAVADIFVQGEEPLAANDIAWAPNLGRLFDLIGVGSVDGISIWRVDYPSYSDPSYADGCPIVKRVAHFRNHQAEVWKVEWDMTGTTLASSGDDGTVRCWKADVAGTWYQRAIVGGAKDLEELQGDGMSG